MKAAEFAAKLRVFEELRRAADEERQLAETDKASSDQELVKVSDKLKSLQAERKAAEDERKSAENTTAALLASGGSGSGGADEESVEVPKPDLPAPVADSFTLRCSNCKDIYLDTRILPCYHSFCSRCILRSGAIAVCRICLNGTRQSSAKANFILGQFIEKVGQVPKPRLCACDQVAVSYCFDCKALLCNGHNIEHSQLIFAKHHKLGTPGESYSPAPVVASDCKTHNKRSTLYCEPCNQLVCIDCLPSHPAHKIITFADAAAKFRPAIERRFTGILASISEKISNQIATLEVQIDEKVRFNRTAAEVKETAKQILEKKQLRFRVRSYIDGTVRVLRTMTDIEVIENAKSDKWFQAIRDVTPDEFEGRVGVVKKFDKLVSFMTPPPARAGNYLGGVFGDGVVLVTSTNYHQVFFYDLVGNKLPTEFGKLSQANSADGFLYYPRALAVDRNGLFLVGDDYGTGRVQVFDKTGVLRKKIIANGNFGNICSITVDYNTGNIFLGDNSNKKVVVYDADGNFVRKFGTAGSGDKEFNYLAGLAISQNGDVIVSDSYALKVFTQDGIFKAKIGNSGKATGEFDGSMGVVVDGAGNVIVADSGNKRLQVFDSNYKFVQQVITPSQKPSALSIDGEGRLLVVEYDTQYFYILG